MATFKTRINKISETKGRVILANDYSDSKNLEKKTINNINTLNPFLCGIKLNFHLLLPLGLKEICKINKLAHSYNLQTIADIKLNDISNTNKTTIENLWKAGFDAVIINPIMGKDAVNKLVKLAHQKNKGVIALCHMSAPEAKLFYEIKVKSVITKSFIPLYQLFLETSISTKVDGIIVGATYPEIIKYCKTKIQRKLNIYSPGIGTQGGDIKKTISAGTDFFIVGRSILDSKNPSETAEKLQKLSLIQ